MWKEFCRWERNNRIGAELITQLIASYKLGMFG